MVRRKCPSGHLTIFGFSLAEYGVVEMPIRTPDDLQLLPVWLKWAEDNLQTTMIELTTKLLEVHLFSLAFACYKKN